MKTSEIKEKFRKKSLQFKMLFRSNREERFEKLKQLGGTSPKRIQEKIDFDKKAGLKTLVILLAIPILALVCLLGIHLIPKKIKATTQVTDSIQKPPKNHPTPNRLREAYILFSYDYLKSHSPQQIEENRILFQENLAHYTLQYRVGTGVPRAYPSSDHFLTDLKLFDLKIDSIRFEANSPPTVTLIKTPFSKEKPSS